MAKHTVTIPDIGGANDVDVIEILVSVGDTIAKDDSLITLESDKASMEIPSPMDGTVLSIAIAIGDKVSEGGTILELETAAQADPQASSTVEHAETAPKEAAPEEETPPAAPAPSALSVKAPSAEPDSAVKPENGDVYAGPAVRRMAHELGVDLTRVTGSGDKHRITKEDIQQFIKSQLAQGPATGTGLNIAAAPRIDFSQFGDIETQPLNKIKRLTAKNVHRSWVTVPHVTQFDEADISEMEAFRQSTKGRAEKLGFKLTPLAFIVKAVSHALKAFPQFNASLDESGDNLILKKYCNVGIAVETPNGLVVPVLRNVDKKGIFDLAGEMAEISKKARNKGITLKDMVGGCFTVSSLGGIGGTAFTPIVNSPEVAILGVSRSKMQPVFDKASNNFVPKLILPLSLSYDHRVIDGAEAARFTRYLCECLADIRTLLL